jgi:hypothetical protein
MEVTLREPGDPEATCCGFFRKVAAAWNYPVEGFCRGLPDGQLMIPTVEEHRTRCSTEGHTICPIYQARMGQGDLAPWLKTERPQWASHPA